MWGKPKNRKIDFDRHAGRTTVIAAGTEIQGDIAFDGGLLIEGVVHGNIHAHENPEALLRVAEGGEVFGDISAPHIIINGSVRGDVYSAEHVELAARAVVHGNVNYNLIEMMMGAEVNGALVHQREPLPLRSRPALREDISTLAAGVLLPESSAAKLADSEH